MSVHKFRLTIWKGMKLDETGWKGSFQFSAVQISRPSPPWVPTPLEFDPSTRPLAFWAHHTAGSPHQSLFCRELGQLGEVAGRLIHDIPWSWWLLMMAVNDGYMMVIYVVCISIYPKICERTGVSIRFICVLICLVGCKVWLQQDAQGHRQQSPRQGHQTATQEEVSQSQLLTNHCGSG